MKKIEIEIPKGYEIDTEKSNLAKGEICFKEKRGLTWEDLGEISGWYIDSKAQIYETEGEDTCFIDTINVFPTKQDAKSVLALAQLLQVRKRMVGDWEADWGTSEEKFMPYRHGYNIEVLESFHGYSELSFPDYAMTANFMEANLDLLKVYFKIG